MGLGLWKTEAREEEAASAEREEEPIQRPLEAPTSALDTCWGVFGFYVRSLSLRVNSPWLPALTSHRANECRASGEARACDSVFVEWSEARWGHCQLEAGMPGPGLAPGSARPATGLGKEDLGAEPEPGALCKRKVNILDWRPGKAVF